jgi:hypothetical protein
MHQKQEQKQPIPSNFSDTTEMKIIRAIHGEKRLETKYAVTNFDNRVESKI